MEDKAMVKKLNQLLAEVQSYRTFMDKVRISDPEAKEYACRLKSCLSNLITNVIIVRNILDDPPEGLGIRESYMEHAVEIINTLPDLLARVKARYRDVLDEYASGEMDKIRSFN